jgi:hypothetical protein
MISQPIGPIKKESKSLLWMPRNFFHCSAYVPFIRILPDGILVAFQDQGNRASGYSRELLPLGIITTYPVNL